MARGRHLRDAVRRRFRKLHRGQVVQAVGRPVHRAGAAEPRRLARVQLAVGR